MIFHFLYRHSVPKISLELIQRKCLFYGFSVFQNCFLLFFFSPGPNGHVRSYQHCASVFIIVIMCVPFAFHISTFVSEITEQTYSNIFRYFILQSSTFNMMIVLFGNQTWLLGQFYFLIGYYFKNLFLTNHICDWIVTGLIVFSATFNNISVILWQSVLLVEEIGVPGENHRPVTSH